MSENTAVMDDASFQATLTTEQHKTYFTNAIKKASDDAVAKFKTESDDARKKAVPEKYTLKFADQSPLDPQEDTEKIAAYCKQNGFSNEQAQAYLQTLEERASALTARQEARRASESERWATEVKQDKDIGGEKLQVTLANTKRVMDRFAPEGSNLRSFLNESGFGNHPEVIRFVNAIGKAMAEDRPSILGGHSGGTKKEFEPRSLYPKSNMA